MTEPTPRLARISVYPIKSLAPVERERAEIVANGGLDGDREYAVVDEDGDYVNGKRTAAVHRIRSTFDEEAGTVTLREADEAPASAETFALDGDREALAAWLGDHFGYDVRVRRDTAGGFPDDTTLSGPTVISTATVREVASWFDGIDEAGMRLRLRANLEIDGVPAFWEDRLYAEEGHEVAFEVGDATLRGANPCRRCVVPARDPHTGEEYPDFRRVFVENRERTLPPWAERSRFEGFFRLMVNTRVAESEWGSRLAVGDPVRVLGERPALEG
jgi:hypothetical protein